MSICPESHKHDGNSVCYKRHGCRCGPCGALALVMRAAQQARVLPEMTCERCGVTRVGSARRRGPWCKDCRATESVEMQKAWAA